MGKFKQLDDFEKRFNSMDAAELVRWRAYWVAHAQNLAPKVRKEAMRRIHRIDKAIQARQTERIEHA
jgi:hypothetical protein